VSDLARALLDELAGDPVELDRLADLLADRVAARLAPRQPSGPELVTVAATAKVLGVSPDTVRRRITEGALPAVLDHGKTMVRADELRSYIDGLERVGQRPGRAPRARARRRYDRLHERSTS
jgi:hypothetical protein